MATVTEVLTAATDSVSLINDINTKGRNSMYAGSTKDVDGDVVASIWTQAQINEAVQLNVDHLETILAYTDPDVAGSSANKSSYTTAITTGNTYISNNPS